MAKTSSRRPADDIRYRPAYSVAEAARLLRLPAATLRSWTSGGPYAAAGERRRFQPLITFDDPERRYLSFMNLVEGHVLTAIRRRHEVALPNVRRALNYVEETLGVDRPLIDQSFQTDGTDLFIENYGRLINASRHGQTAMKEIVGAYLRRIERDPTGLPSALYPFTRVNAADEAPKSDPRLVMISPEISFGRPVVKGTGVPVAEIYERFQAGDSSEDLERDFNLSGEAVDEAIRSQAA